MGRKRSPDHLSTRTHTRVLVIMWDGTRFTARFKERSGDSRTLTFFDHEPVRARDVRALNRYIPNGGSNGYHGRDC